MRQPSEDGVLGWVQRSGFPPFGPRRGKLRCDRAILDGLPSRSSRGLQRQVRLRFRCAQAMPDKQPQYKLVKAAMLRITRCRGPPKIWIDDALGGAARCRRSTLRQRGEVTFDAIPKYAEGLHADRVARVIRLSPNWRGHKNRRSYQNCQNRCAHHHVPGYNAA